MSTLDAGKVLAKQAAKQADNAAEAGKRVTPPPVKNPLPYTIHDASFLKGFSQDAIANHAARTVPDNTGYSKGLDVRLSWDDIKDDLPEIDNDLDRTEFYEIYMQDGSLESTPLFNGQVEDGVLKIDFSELDERQKDFLAYVKNSKDTSSGYNISVMTPDGVFDEDILPTGIDFGNGSRDMRWGVQGRQGQPRYNRNPTIEDLKQPSLGKYYNNPLMPDLESARQLVSSVVFGPNAKFMLSDSGDVVINTVRDKRKVLEDTGSPSEGLRGIWNKQDTNLDTTPRGESAQDYVDTESANIEHLGSVGDFYDEILERIGYSGEEVLYTMDTFLKNGDKRPVMWAHGESHFTPSPKGGQFISDDLPLEFGTHWGPFATSKTFFSGAPQRNLKNRQLEWGLEYLNENLHPFEAEFVMEAIEDAILERASLPSKTKGAIHTPHAGAKSSDELAKEIAEEIKIRRIEDGGDLSAEEAFEEVADILGEEGIGGNQDYQMERHLKLLVNAAYKQADSMLSTGFLNDLKSPLVLVDNGSWKPRDIIAQIIDIPNFDKYEDEFFDLLKRSSDEESEDFLFVTNRLKEILRDEGFDHILYVNRHEGRGSPAIITFDGGQHQVTNRKNYRSRELTAEDFTGNYDKIFGFSGLGLTGMAQQQEANASQTPSEARSGDFSGNATSETDDIIETILVNEGGFQDDPDDRGNIVDGKVIGTNFGITPAALAEYRGVDPRSITVQDIKGLTRQEAADIYEDRYLKAPKIDQLPEAIRANVADMGVNAGPARAIKILQRLIGVAEDGIIGPATLKAAEGISSSDYSDARDEYYKEIAKGEKQKYLNGWLNRSDKFRKDKKE